MSSPTSAPIVAAGAAGLAGAERAAWTRAAARALREHLGRRHLATAGPAKGALVGPDVSGRITIRAGRFVKAALPFLPWHDEHVSLQGLGYWARLHGLLYARGEDADDARHTLEAAAACVLARQAPDGSWSWREHRTARVATFEGDWAAVVLLEAYWATGDRRYADAALRWPEYLAASGAFRPYGDGTYVGYWSDRDVVIPNNSAEMLWILSELAKVGEPAAVELMPGLLRFLAAVQLPSGELPYRAASSGAAARPHYLCYQYNAFELLALVRYVENTGDAAAEPLIRRLAGFLMGGIGPNGGCRTSCQAVCPEVDYYTAALALALRRVEGLVGSMGDAVDRLTDRLLMMQRRDGSYGYSRRDYGLPLLADGRSYPRTQAIIAYALAALADPDVDDLGQRRGDGMAL